MYLTTSKLPSPLTEMFCARLEHLFPFCVYRKRGKRSMEKIIEEARALGKRRVCLIYEEKKTPRRMVFLSTDDKWSWLKPEIIIKDFPQRNIRARFNSIEISGSRRKDLLLLLHPRETDEEPVRLKAGERKLSFFQNKKEIFWMKVGYS